MREYIWRWLFWSSVVFCGLLSSGLVVAYILYSAAPHNPNTPVFAMGFGFTFGFIGLSALTVILFDRVSKRLDTTPEEEGELMKRLARETPFFTFSLLLFFSLALFMGIFMLMLPYIRNACS